ncbi:MAG: helix-turn-helix domain-containing protein [Clostridiaceae bacterium]|nr:helix-turn-helix domain-containing protein [Clostridiaceae bacterium]
MKLEQYPDVLTVEQLCKALQIGKSLAYSLLKNGLIKSRIIGRAYRIPKINVLDYLDLTH